ATAYLSSNILQRVPTVAYCLVMLLAALLNMKVNRTATSPPMVDERAAPADILYVRQRGWSVVLGAATSVLLAFVQPEIGQLALITIPLWRLLLVRWAGRGSGARARA